MPDDQAHALSRWAKADWEEQERCERQHEPTPMGMRVVELIERALAGAAIELAHAAIEALDAIEGDCDLEPEEDDDGLGNTFTWNDPTLPVIGTRPYSTEALCITSLCACCGATTDTEVIDIA